MPALPLRAAALAALSVLLVSCGGSDAGAGPDFDEPGDNPPPAVTVSAVTAVSSPGSQAVGGSVEVRFRVDGSNGQPMAGVTVAFTTSGGGLVSPASATSASDGIVSTAWTFGTTPGTQTLQASVGGRSGSVTATTVAAAASQMILASGDGQTANVGSALPSPVVVAVRDRFGNSVAGVAVSFAVTAGGGSVSPASATTGPDGLASTAWTLGATAGEQTLAAQAQGLTAVSAKATGQVRTQAKAFDIQIRLVGTVPAAVKAALDSAEARWEEIITGDLADTPVQVPAGYCENAHPAVDETVDDVVIFVEVKNIDGPGNTLAAAGGCVGRQQGGLPVLGSMDVDAADVQAMINDGTLGSTMLHEIGHILGIGNLWEDFKTLQGGGTSNPTYTGTQGVAQYKALGGTLAAIPVENTGGEGTADSHWRTSVFKNEVMVGYSQPLPNPLSVMTIGALLDLGYQADLAKADAYAIPPLGAPERVEAGDVPSRPWEVLRRYKVMVTPDGRLHPVR